MIGMMGMRTGFAQAPFKLAGLMKSDGITIDNISIGHGKKSWT